MNAKERQDCEDFRAFSVVDDLSQIKVNSTSWQHNEKRIWTGLNRDLSRNFQNHLSKKLIKSLFEQPSFYNSIVSFVLCFLFIHVLIIYQCVVSLYLMM